MDYVFCVIPGSNFTASVDSPTGDGELLIPRESSEAFTKRYPGSHIRELLPAETARLQKGKAVGS